jgi:hypothetical protein
MCSFFHQTYAQVVQNGTVKEYHLHKKKTSLSGVEVQVKSANSTVSDRHGSFALEFHTLTSGEKVNIRKIEKLGYEIFNKDALEQWNINPNVPFVIVMVRSDKFKELRDTYSRESSKSYEEQYLKEKAKLEEELKAGRISEEKLREEIASLRDYYDHQLDNLDNYVDRFARIDLSELSAKEQEIIELVQSGNMDLAIRKYEQMALVDKYEKLASDKAEMERAQQTLEKKLHENSQSITEIWSQIKRQLDAYMLAGGRENYKKTLALIERVMKCSSTNLWMRLSLLSYLKNQDSLPIYESCDLSEIKDPVEQLRARDGYAIVLFSLGQYEKATEQAQIIYDMAKEVGNSTYIVIGKTLMADICSACFKDTEALAIYSELCQMIDDEKYGDAFTISDRAEIYSSMSGFYQNTDAEKFLYYHTLSYDLYEEVYRLAPTQHNARKLLHSKVGQAIALRWFTVGSGLTPSDKGYDNIYKSVDLLLEVIPTIETLSKEDFKRYCHISVVAQSTLAENYFFLQEYGACETYFIKALQVMEKANERNIEIYNEVNHGQLFNNLGYLYYICKDYEKGEQAFLKSIEVLSPYVKSNYSLYALNIYFRALINVAVLYNDTAKYDLALKYGYEGLEHSETLYNYSAEMFYAEYVLILKTLALAENSLGNTDKAIELIEKAIVAEPANAELKEIKAKFIGE